MMSGTHMDPEDETGELSSKDSIVAFSKASESCTRRQGAPDSRSQNSDQSQKSITEKSQRSSRSMRSETEKSIDTSSTRHSSSNSSRHSKDRRQANAKDEDDRMKRADRLDHSRRANVEDKLFELASAPTRFSLENRSRGVGGKHSNDQKGRTSRVGSSSSGTTSDDQTGSLIPSSGMDHRRDRARIPNMERLDTDFEGIIVPIRPPLDDRSRSRRRAGDDERNLKNENRGTRSNDDRDRPVRQRTNSSRETNSSKGVRAEDNRNRPSSSSTRETNSSRGMRTTDDRNRPRSSNMSETNSSRGMSSTDDRNLPRSRTSRENNASVGMRTADDRYRPNSSSILETNSSGGMHIDNDRYRPKSSSAGEINSSGGIRSVDRNLPCLSSTGETNSSGGIGTSDRYRLNSNSAGVFDSGRGIRTADRDRPSSSSAGETNSIRGTRTADDRNRPSSSIAREAFNDTKKKFHTDTPQEHFLPEINLGTKKETSEFSNAGEYSSNRHGFPDSSSQNSDQSRKSRKSGTEESQRSSRSTRSHGEKSIDTSSTRRHSDDRPPENAKKGEDGMKRADYCQEEPRGTLEDVKRLELTSAPTRPDVDDRNKSRKGKPSDDNKSITVSASNRENSTANNNNNRNNWSIKHGKITGDQKEAREVSAFEPATVVLGDTILKSGTKKIKISGPACVSQSSRNTADDRLLEMNQKSPSSDSSRRTLDIHAKEDSRGSRHGRREVVKPREREDSKDDEGSKNTTMTVDESRPDESEGEEESARKGRREFWGNALCDRGLMKRNSSVVDSNLRENFLGTAITTTPGTSAMFRMFDKELSNTRINSDVLQVYKLMFASLSVVFCATSTIPTDQHSPFSYTRIPSIPVQAARMLWSELIGGAYCSFCPKTGMYVLEINEHEIISKRDPSISEEAVKTFIKYINCEEVPEATRPRAGFLSRFQPTKKVAPKHGFFGFGSMPASNVHDRDKSDRRAKTKDPFLFQIREFLVEHGFLELAGRRIDDPDEDEMETLFDESDITNEDEYEGYFAGDDSDVELDFFGWNERKVNLRARKRSQYFQIYKDMQHQYGVFLSSLHVHEGGFALMETNSNEAIRSSVFQEFDTMKRWTDAMSKACLRKLYEDQIIMVDHVRGSIAEGMPVDDMPSMTKMSPFGDATSYALQMYPSHLMRCGRVMEASRILTNQRFFYGRILALGAFDATNQHRANLDELFKRSKLAREGIHDFGGDGASIDPVDVEKTTVAVMISVLTATFPVGDIGTAIKGEREKGEVGRAFHLIGTFIAESGDAMAAVEIYERALRLKILILGENHSSVARTFRHMAHQYLFQCDYEQAVRYYEESVRIERTQIEIDHRRIILSLNSIGMIYGMIGKHEKAIETYAQSLAIQKANLGDTHPQVAETLNSMGIVYGMMGVFDKSVECYSEALFIKIRRHGPEHIDVADVHFNLGLVHNKRGDHDSAISCYQEALRIRKDKFGDEHEEVARVLHHIGVALSDMGEVGDAMRFYEECLRIRRLILGDEHEDVARTLHNLGLVYYENCNYDKALECFEDAIRLGRQKFGKKNEKVADTLYSMGLVYQKLANFKEAISSYEEALIIRRLKLGPDHLEVALTLHNMGDVYYMMGELESAMAAYKDAYDFRLGKLGPDDVDVAATRNNMGVVYMKKGEHDNAMQCFTDALRIREAQLGPDHEKCSDTLHNMGLVHKNLKEYDQAIVRYDQALRSRKIQLGDCDMKVADTLYNMAIVYANTGKFTLSLEKYKEALRTYRETGMADDHPSIVNTLQWIRWAQKKLSKAPRKDLHLSR